MVSARAVALVCGLVLLISLESWKRNEAGDLLFYFEIEFATLTILVVVIDD